MSPPDDKVAIEGKPGQYRYNLTRHIPDQNDMYSPRVGVTWSPWQKTALRLTAGRFYSRTPSLLFAQNNTSNGYRGTQYTIGQGAGIPPTDPLASYLGWGATWVPEGVERIPFEELTTIPTGVGVYTFPEDYKNAHTDRITAEWEQQIYANTGVTFNVTWAEAKDLEYLTDLNLLSPRCTVPLFFATDACQKSTGLRFARQQHQVSAVERIKQLGFVQSGLRYWGGGPLHSGAQYSGRTRQCPATAASSGGDHHSRVQFFFRFSYRRNLVRNWR